MENYYWFSLFVALNATLLVLLAVNVSYLRLKLRVSSGDGGHKQLMKAMRVHANGIEQVPIFALLILGLSFVGASQTILAVLVLAFTFSRLSHAVGMLYRKHLARQIGAGLTYLLQLAASVILLAGMFTY